MHLYRLRHGIFIGLAREGGRRRNCVTYGSRYGSFPLRATILESHQRDSSSPRLVRTTRWTITTYCFIVNNPLPNAI